VSPGCQSPQAERATACAPNHALSCDCPGGASGVQACTQDGLSYGSCLCTEQELPQDDIALQLAEDLPEAATEPEPGILAEPATPQLQQHDPPIDPLPPGGHTLSLRHGGTERVFDLMIPELAGAEPLPLVVNFHGFSMERLSYEAMTLYGFKGAMEGFVVATPDGVDRSWNGGAACCGNASAAGLDDVGFALALVDEIERASWIDPDRIYAVGFSNGSFMVQRLGCEAAHRFAAVAAVAGGLSAPDVLPGCAPARPIPIVLYFGTADPSYLALADASYNAWKLLNGCSEETQISYQQGVVTCVTHRSCNGGVELTRCLEMFVDHCWPGAPCAFSQTHDIDATHHSYDFLSGFGLSGVVGSP